MYEKFHKIKTLESELKRAKKELFSIRNSEFQKEGKISRIQNELKNLNKEDDDGFPPEYEDRHRREQQGGMCEVYANGGLAVDDYKAFKKSKDYKGLDDFQKSFIDSTKERISYYSPALEECTLKCYSEENYDLNCDDIDFWTSMIIKHYDGHKSMSTEEYENSQEAIKVYSKNLLK